MSEKIGSHDNGGDNDGYYADKFEQIVATDFNHDDQYYESLFQDLIHSDTSEIGDMPSHHDLLNTIDKVYEYVNHFEMTLDERNATIEEYVEMVPNAGDDDEEPMTNEDITIWGHQEIFDAHVEVLGAVRGCIETFFDYNTNADERLDFIQNLFMLGNAYDQKIIDTLPDLFCSTLYENVAFQQVLRRTYDHNKDNEALLRNVFIGKYASSFNLTSIYEMADIQRQIFLDNPET